MIITLSLNLAQRAALLRALDTNKEQGIGIGRTIRTLRRDFKLSEGTKAADELVKGEAAKGPVNVWEVLLEAEDRPQEFTVEEAHLRWLRDRLDKGDAGLTSPSALVEIVIDLHDAISDALAKNSKAVN